MGKNVFVTGPAGSGKTYVVNQYISYLREHQVGVAITASTGIAATHLGGMTIHSWSGMGIKAGMDEIEIEALTEKSYLARRFEATKVLVIDEVSMLHDFRLDLIDQISRRMKKTDLPFGGMQVVLCGDFFQLPPVSRLGEPDANFIYASQAWRDGGFTVCYLSEQFRQKDDIALTILNEIRAGEVSDESRELLRGRHIDVVTRTISPVSPTRLFTHNINVDTVNDTELAKVAGAEFEYQMRSKGKMHIVETLKKSCLAPETLRLRKGARVMCVKNNFEAGYVNGTLGIVVSCGPDMPPVIRIAGQRGEPAKTVTIEEATWKIEEEGRTIAEITQYPLRLAWAITVHKSQGMSLDAVEVDLSRAFAPGMGYVALSRVRTLEGLTILGINEAALHVHSEVLEFDHELKRQSLDAEIALEDLVSTGEATKAQDEFLARVAPLHKMGRKTKIAKGKSDPADDSYLSKASTYSQTADLVRSKRSLKEMAKERGFVVETIIDHIEHLIRGGVFRDGVIDSIDDELSLDEIQYLKKEISYPHFKKIEEAFAAIEDEKDKKKEETGPPPSLSPVKHKLGANISFKEIRLARVLLGYIKKK